MREISKSPDAHIHARAITDRGKARPQNEDAFSLSPEDGILIVSDGMGGHNAGSTAAQYVVESLPSLIVERTSQISASRSKQITLAIRDAIVDLSQKVRAEGESKVKLRGMGATVVMAYLRKPYLYIANMGDSRAYLYRDNNLKQLTSDHSIVGILVEDGEITAEEAKTHPSRGTVSRYVGIEGIVYPDVMSIKIKDGDQLLLCSDGLTGMVSDEDIASILFLDVGLQQTCQSLVNAANDAGGRDNITVLVAKFAE